MFILLIIVSLTGILSASGGGQTSGDFMTTGILINNEFNFNLYNPARTSLFNRSEIYLQRSSMSAGTGFYYGSLNWLIGAAGTAGAGWVRFGTDDIDARDATGAPAGAVSDMYSVWLLSYAHRLLPSIAVGTNTKLVYRNLYGEKAAGFGADLGIVLIPTRFQFFDNFSVGCNLQNIIRPTLTYGFSGPDTRETWPRSLRSNLLMTLFNGRLDLGLGTNVINIIPDNTNPSSARRFSLDYSLKFRPNRLMSIVLGYNNQTVRLGWMLGYKGNQEINLMTTYNSFWGSTTHLAASHRFGETRDEKLLLIRARSGRFKADESYRQAYALFEAGDWMNAVLKFKEVIMLFPRFPDLDKAYYYQGRCYDELGLPFGAAGSYTALVRDFPQSVLREQTYRRLAGIYSRTGNQGELNAVYQELTSSDGGSQASQETRLHLGRYLFRADTSSDASVILSGIPENSVFYHAAQYYCAADQVRRRNYPGARVHLANILRTASPETFRSPNLSLLAVSAMGNCYFESAQYDSALAYYRRVPDASAYHPQSLLARAWCRYHLAQYDTMLTVLNGLTPSIPMDHPYFYEIRFLTGQANYLDGNYADAESVFSYLTEMSLADSVFSSTDTTGLDSVRGDMETRLAAVRRHLDAFDRELYAHPFYKPLPAQKRRQYRTDLAEIDRYRSSLDSLQNRVALYNSRTLWMGNAYDMMAKATRAVTEARLYQVYMKYTPRINELEKQLYEMAPTGFSEDLPRETPSDDVEVEELDESEKRELLEESGVEPDGQP